MLAGMSHRSPVVLFFLLVACDGAPGQSAPAPSTPAIAATPEVPAAPKPDAPPGDPAFDVVAEQLEIESLSPGVTWVREAVVREVLFAIASGAWTLEQGKDGMTLRVGRAARLATRLGLRDGELVTAIDEISLRSSASARTVLDRFAAGERVRVTVQRDGAEQRMFFRVSGPGRHTQERATDLIAAGRHDAPEPAIERSVLLAFGAAQDRLSDQPERVLKLLGLPPDATEVGLDGESVVLADLPRLLGERALAERLELTAGGHTLALRVVTGTVETTALGDALRSLSRRSSTPPRGLPGPVDPLLTPPTDVEPLLEGEAVPGIEKIDDTHYRIERALLDATLTDTPGAARLARIVPSLKEGATPGFKLYAVRRSSGGRVGLRSFGFANGDLVTAVNGQALGDIDDLLAVYTSLRKAKSLVIAIERRDSAVELTIEIVEKL